MKIQAGRAEAFARSPDPKVRAVLVYGPDVGLVRERAVRLVKSAAESLDDPFRVAELTGPGVAGDPASLLDELGALSFGGGRRAVRLRDAADNSSKAIEQALGDPVWEALLVVEGGDLPARSALRKLFEAGDGAAALPCYRDDRQALATLVGDTLKQAGLSIERDAQEFLVARLGGDRALSRREIEKLVLYMGNDSSRPIQREDILASVADASEATLEDLVYAVADGDTTGCVRWTKRSYEEGVAPITLLRATANHMQRLLIVAAAQRRGDDLDSALRRLRPPVFWKVKGRFTKQVSAWRQEKLTAALSDLIDAETACKSTGAPAESIAARALLSLSARARR